VAQLLSAKPTPMTYDTKDTPAEVLTQDKSIAASASPHPPSRIQDVFRGNHVREVEWAAEPGAGRYHISRKIAGRRHGRKIFSRHQPRGRGLLSDRSSSTHLGVSAADPQFRNQRSTRPMSP